MQTHAAKKFELKEKVKKIHDIYPQKTEVLQSMFSKVINKTASHHKRLF
jgi:hypothetical protein